MDRIESQALENILSGEQLLACIDEQKHRAMSLNMLSSLTDIAIEKGFNTMEQLEQEIRKLQARASQVDLVTSSEEEQEEVSAGVPTAPPAGPVFAAETEEEDAGHDPYDFLSALTDQEDEVMVVNEEEVKAAEAEKEEDISSESSMQKNLLAQLAYSGEVDSELCEAALTEVAGQSLVGKIVLGYRLTFLIGEGPISDVFKVVKPGEDRALCLKVFSKRLFKTPLLIRRFLSRIRRASKLQHPNILQTLDFGETEHHICYVLTEFVEAVPLWLLIKRQGRISEKMSLAILRFIARGLENAHKSGVIHGNMKPANVLITPKGVVKITDWGTPRTCMLLAWNKLDEDAARFHLISEGLAYLAPEIIMGETEIDGPCDIYSLGTILYHLVVGAPPFEGEREQVLKSIPRGFPKVPDGLLSPVSQELLANLTAVNPKERIRKAPAAVEAIEEVLKKVKSG